MDPRQNVGWERAVIGTVLADPASMEAAETLAPQDFTGTNKLIWAEILGLHRRHALEARALIEALRSNKTLEEIGSDAGNSSGEDYIAELLECRGGQIEEYVRQVAEQATRRELRNAAALIAADALNGNHRPLEELLDEAERRIMQLRRTRHITGNSLAQILQAFMPRLEGMRTGAVKPAFVPKLQALRDIVDYFDQSDYVLIAGRPGEGKSSWLRFEAFWKAKEGIPGLIFNLENDDLEYAKAMISLDSGIDSKKLRNSRLLTPAELERIRNSAVALASLPLEIVTLGAPSVADIERIARTKIRTLKPRYIMVDYVQLIQNGLENRVNDVSLSSQSLRAMAMANRFHIPVIAASQLSREIERRGTNADPELADLRDSGSLEQDGVTIIFIRQVWHNPQTRDIARFPENVNPSTGGVLSVIRAEPIRMHVLKNRNGPTGVTGPIKWVKCTGNFQTLTEERQ